MRKVLTICAVVTMVLAVSTAAIAVTVDGVLGVGEWDSHQITTSGVAGGTPVSAFNVYAYADTDWLYIAYQIDGATESAGLAMNVGLKNGTPKSATSHNGAWSLALEDWVDFTTDDNMRCKFNDNVESSQTRDVTATALGADYISGRSGTFGNVQFFEFAFSMNLLADVFSDTYTDGTVGAGTVLGLSGHFLQQYSGPWNPAYYGDGLSYANVGNYVPLTVVPEPATMCLLGLGGLLLRRRKSA